jgi:hypothetical protein
MAIPNPNTHLYCQGQVQEVGCRADVQARQSMGSGLVGVQRPLPARYLRTRLEVQEDKCNGMHSHSKAGLLIWLICGPRVLSRAE